MFKRSRVAVSALLAFGLAGALAGFAASASAAPGQVCYFGECRASTGPSAQTAPAPTPAPTQSRVIAKNGSWSVTLVGQSNLGNGLARRGHNPVRILGAVVEGPHHDDLA